MGLKDTARNARDTGEFVVNLATRPLAEAMNRTTAEVPPDVDEFELAGLTPRASVQVRPPAVTESPVALECRVTSVQQLADAAGRALDTWMVFGEIVHAHVAHALLDAGCYGTAAARPILRGGGPADYYARGAVSHAAPLTPAAGYWPRRMEGVVRAAFSSRRRAVPRSRAPRAGA